MTTRFRLLRVFGIWMCCAFQLSLGCSPVPNDVCLENVDCSKGQFCNTETGQCGPCRADSDCDEDALETCVEGLCTLPKTCNSNDDCAEPNRCLGNVCTLHKDCENGTTRRCYSQKSGCNRDGDGFICTGSCKDGLETCKGYRWTGTCEGETIPDREVCNGKDDDCDGNIDNQPGTTEPLLQACYTGEDGCTKQSDESFTCNAPCKAGTRRCDQNSWSACAGSVTPGVEICNGKDDDCDGKVDDNPTDIPKCSNQTGPCKGSRHAASSCRDGRWPSLCTDKDYTLTFPRYGQEEVCDGYDNDCNGLVDEWTKTAPCLGTLAGNSMGHQNGRGLAARFTFPIDIDADNKGNLYVAENRAHVIRKITPCGQVTLLAGVPGTSGYRDRAVQGVQAALFYDPRGLAVTPSGVVYVSDSRNNRIRKIDTKGNVTTVAGEGTADYKDGPALQAQFDQPDDLVVDDMGNIYVSDGGNHRIRKIDTKGNVTTVAGLGPSGFKDGLAPQAQFNTPRGLVLGSIERLYIVDENNHSIRKLERGQVTTVAGDGRAGSKDGPALQAQLDGPKGIDIDADGNLYIADMSGGKIRKLDTKGSVSTLLRNFSTTPQDGPDSTATISNPGGVALYKDILYIADMRTHRIRSLQLRPQAPFRCVSTLAGTGDAGSKDGPALEATFSSPQRIATDHLGNLFLTSQNAVRKISPSGEVTTVAGGVSTTEFSKPLGLAVDADGNIFVADTENHRIRKVDRQGKVTTFAGSDERKFGNKDGAGAIALFKRPYDVAIDKRGHLIVADYTNDLLRKITPQGVVSTIAGVYDTPGSRDGPAKTNDDTKIALLFQPRALAIDAQGNIIFSDSNRKVRMLSTTGQVSTIDTFGKVDYPGSLAVDLDGNIYVVDGSLNSIWLVSRKHRTIKRLVGGGSSSKFGFEDGLLEYAKLNSPRGLALSPDGSLYFTQEHIVRAIFAR